MGLSYADHPKSLAEVRANKAGDGALWKPRDALIDMLRLIDQGEIDADALVICYSETMEDGLRTSFSCACENSVMALGLVTRVLYRMNATIDR